MARVVGQSIFHSVGEEQCPSHCPGDPGQHLVELEEEEWGEMSGGSHPAGEEGVWLWPQKGQSLG